VVVVDNGSTDASAVEIRRAMERDGGRWKTIRVEILLSPTNLGFAGGNNLGLRHLQPDALLTHFLLLNNDATVAPDYFAELARALDSAPDAGLLSGTVHYAADRARAWYAGGRIVPLRGTVSHGTRVPARPDPRPTGFVSGCALVISRAAWEMLGALADCYHPMYWEDAEYSVRAGRAGLLMLYVPRAVVYHRVTASATTLPRQVEYLYAWHRNRGFFVRRNLRGGARGVATAYLIAGKLVHGAWCTLTGRPREGWAILRGTIQGLVEPLPANG
jgi:GT2 family glycosyltransferase